MHLARKFDGFVETLILLSPRAILEEDSEFANLSF